MSKALAELCVAQNALLVTAESCTGGGIAAAITDTPGSSQWFDRGFVTYSNAAKQDMLGVLASTLEQFGAVSENTAREMAEGALQHSQATHSVSVTGIAGPDGGTKDKPVGTVWFGFAQVGAPTQCMLQHFSGDRQQIRQLAVNFALTQLQSILS